MFEANYRVSLSVLHPTIDPDKITATIRSFSPRISIKAGENGQTRARPAQFTHWLADLSSDELQPLNGQSLSSFLLKRLTQLSNYKQFLSQLSKEGTITLVIGWFSDTNHSADILESHVLKRCGDLGIDVELDFYAPPIAEPIVQRRPRGGFTDCRGEK